MVVGVDGCKIGWLAVSMDDNERWSAQAFGDITTLWQEFRRASILLVDIPIGLRGKSLLERLCDLEARRLLGRKRGSSVFPAPSRKALRAKSYVQACDINEKATGRRLSRQSWAIAGKIRQVDDLLRRNASARRKIREVHPEICFWALAGGRAMTRSKKRKQGYLERLDVLISVCPEIDSLTRRVTSDYKRSEVARDDILDAAAAAVTACSAKRHLRTVPSAPEIDSMGLPMEMLYTQVALRPAGAEGTSLAFS